MHPLRRGIQFLELPPAWGGCLLWKSVVGGVAVESETSLRPVLDGNRLCTPRRFRPGNRGLPGARHSLRNVLTCEAARSAARPSSRWGPGRPDGPGPMCEVRMDAPPMSRRVGRPRSPEVGVTSGLPRGIGQGRSGTRRAGRSRTDCPFSRSYWRQTNYSAFLRG